MKRIKGQKILLIIGIIFIYNLGAMAQSSGKQEPGFSNLFNGENLNGWVTTKDAEGVEVKDGVLISKGPNTPDLIHARENLGNFVLRFEFKLSGNGASGVMIRYDEEDPRAGGFEIQLATPETGTDNPLKSTGSIYNLVAVTNPPEFIREGEWNEMEIVCDRKQILVVVNGRLTTWGYMDEVTGLEKKQLQGMLGFQGNQGGEDEWVRFRNIRINNLDLNPEYVLKGFYSGDGRVRKQAHGKAVKLQKPMVDLLCNNLDHDNIKVSSGSRKVIQDIVALASDPESKKGPRNALKNKLRNYQSRVDSKYAKQFIGQQLKLLE